VSSTTDVGLVLSGCGCAVTSIPVDSSRFTDKGTDSTGDACIDKISGDITSSTSFIASESIMQSERRSRPCIDVFMHCCYDHVLIILCTVCVTSVA
jgi:hypothetical protein